MSKNLRNQLKMMTLNQAVLISFDFASFLTFNRRYLRSLWMDFDEKYHFGNVMSCSFYDKKFIRKFYEFHCQIWLQSWNLMKIGKVHKEFWNNFEVSSNLLGHILLFRFGMWEVSPKTLHTQFLCCFQLYKLPLKTNRVFMNIFWFYKHLQFIWATIWWEKIFSMNE